jgi:16S rRNA A1518/A1519 N6-dimethyltransferase RsmA/KsgA/DIM1 with predicted DNA glycosylase/AP lyase activity
MTEEIKKDPLDDEIINFSFTVAQINGLLQILANTPYVVSAPLIGLINMQGEPQFRAAIERLEKAKNEPKAAA